MTTNRGKSTLCGRKRHCNPMQEYDSLPPELRAWVATAQLPWSAHSVRTAYRKAIARQGDARLALQKLDQIQASLISKDAGRIWGNNHPDAQANHP